MGKFNLLKDAYSLKNTTTCRYDSLNGYITNFKANGDVNGWDIYSGINMYGAWNSVLFGTSTQKSCFISRSNPFVPVNAEKYYMLKITMKLTLPDNYGKKTPPTKGKVMWTKASDPTWLEDHSKEFDLVFSDQWHTYIINLGEAKYWISDINNMRIYPMLDGFDDINFMIKAIAIDSIDEFTCLNTQCSYYSQFSHPCPGAGTRASISSGIPMSNYTTISGVNDKLILNIDDYGDEHIRLGHNENLTGVEMAKIMVDRISRVNIGQYAYAEVTYLEEEGKLTIESGAMDDGSTIKLSGEAAQVLGFVDELGDDVSEFTQGQASATGFDFGSSRRLKGFELNSLVDSNLETSAYYHNPDQYNVEAGRRDFSDSMSSNYAPHSDKVEYYELLDGSQKLIIDASHPVNDSGRISKFWLNGEYVTKKGTQDVFTPKVYVLRPDKNNRVKVVHELEISIEEQSLRYTVDHVTFRVDCDVPVNKGDLIGFYNVHVLMPYSTRNQTPNGVFFVVPCGSDGPADGKFDMGPPMAQGVIGMSFYARSDRIQKDIQLDIDIGERTNIENISVHGKEFSDSFEYNIASCLDVNWTVDCHNQTHWHKACTTCRAVIMCTFVEHRNIPYGVECLSDCLTTPDGGQAGDNFIIRSIGPTVNNDGFGNFGNLANSDPDYYSGIETYGKHSYCYVNGDAEWLNGGCFPNAEGSKGYQAEFKSPYSANIYAYQYDPITYRLTFPAGKELTVHKSIMYFKETQNFKRYSLAYYLGENGEFGNAEEPHYSFIPSYNSVTLDGIKVEKEHSNGNPLTQVYEKTLFSNPTPWALPEFQDGVCTNWDIYQTVMQTEMNVLQHDFDPVDCKGFKIRTTWHKSTKITEMELYSSIPVEPTLLDNVRIQTSIYGDEWEELHFTADELNDEKIDAHVPSNPRYFRLQLQSQDIFELKELSAEISQEHIKSLDCTDIILQDHAPKYQFTSPKELVLENTYDVPLDLSISVPNQLFKERYVLSWIRFDSEETTYNGEIGPGAIVRKSEDYPIFLADGQVANNTPAYYLKNLIYDKPSYRLVNDHAWQPYKNLQIDEDVNVVNTPNGKVTDIGFKATSAKFWKLSSYETRSTPIENIKLYHNDNSDITPITVTNDFEGITELDPTLWDMNTGAVIENGKLKLTAEPGQYPRAKSNFFIEGDFEVYIRGSVNSRPSGTYLSGPLLKALSAVDTGRQIEIYYHVPTSLSSTMRFAHRKDGVWTTTDTWGVSESHYDSRIYFKMKRVGDTFTTSFSDAGLNDNFLELDSYTYTNFGSKVYIEMALWNSSSSSTTTSVNFHEIQLLNGYAFLGDLHSSFSIINEIPVDKVYIQAEHSEGSGKLETTFDTETQSINPAVVLEDDFSDGVWIDRWKYHLGYSSSNNFIEKNGGIHPVIAPGETIYIENEFLPGAVSFNAEVHFNLEFPTKMMYAIDFIGPDDSSILEVRLMGYDSNTARLIIKTYTPPDQEALQEGDLNWATYNYKNGTFKKSNSQYKDGFIFSCTKVYRNFSSLKFTNSDKTITYYNSTTRHTSYSRVSKIRISHMNLTTSAIEDQIKNYSTTYVKFEALPQFSDKESIVFGFKNSQPLDSIRLVQPSGNIEAPVVTISDHDNDDYRMWAKGFDISPSLSEGNYSIYASNPYYDTYYIDSRPEWCFNDETRATYLRDDFSHWIAYDFGAGNGRKINHIYYEGTFYSDNIETTYFKVCHVYGTNKYNTLISKTESDVINTNQFDLTGATLLTEFNISYSYPKGAYNLLSFTNNTPFRYIVFHFPYATTNEKEGVWIQQIRLYEDLGSGAPSGILLDNNNYIDYLAIDLQRVHNLDFLRNYGSESNLLDVYTQKNLSYSDTPTSDIDEVVWLDDMPTLLFNFNYLVDAVNTDRQIFTEGSLTLKTSGSPVDSGNHLFLGKDVTIYSGETSTSANTGSNLFYVIADRTFSPINCTGMTKEYGVLEVQLYVRYPEEIDHLQFEITSNSSVYDTNEWHYYANDSGNDPLNLINSLTSSYKTFRLPLSYFGSSGAPLDPANIRRLRFYIRSRDDGNHDNNAVGFKNTKVHYMPIPTSMAINHFYDLWLGAHDFTIDFWFKREIFGQAGIAGQISEHSTSSSFSFTFSNDDYLKATFYSGGTIYEMSSINTMSDTDWHHVAVCRHNSVLAFYIDGYAQTNRDIGISTMINECVEQLYLGKVDLDYFGGYLDEFRILVGQATWKSNFNVPTEPYTVTENVGDKTSARWVRIALTCGDGVTRNINKLGIYPDISVPYLPTGGYNCEWEPLYNRLSNFVNNPRNLSARATVINDSLIEEDFETEDLEHWNNLNQTNTLDLIIYSDFSEESAAAFWASGGDWFNNPESYVSYSLKGQTYHFADSESGGAGHYTDYIYSKRHSCEAYFSFSSAQRTNRFQTGLRMYTDDGLYFEIKRHMYSTNERVDIYHDGGTPTTRNTAAVAFKIERIDDSVLLYFKETLDSDWFLLYTYLDQEHLKSGDVRYRFLCWKETAYAEVDAHLHSLRVYESSATSEEIEWGIVPSDYGNNAFGIKTYDVPVEFGPEYVNPLITNGARIKSFECYYFNSGAGGGGFSFTDLNGAEVFGFATIDTQWTTNSKIGWDVLNAFPTNGDNVWYRVKTTFDWENGIVTIDWEDTTDGTVLTYTRDLILSTEVAKIQIKGTLGLGWGPDIMDIKFDNITIAPVSEYMQDFEPANCLTGDLSQQGFENCWGFPASVEEPTLLVDLGEVYRVDKFVLHSRPYDSNYDFLINDFDIYGATSVSGTFDLLVSETGFSASFEFPYISSYRLDDPVNIQIVKLVVKKYSKPSVLPVARLEDRDGVPQYVTLDGGYLREFEIWLCPDSELINSEDHPIICMDLQDQFNLTYHTIEGPDSNNLSGINSRDWNNDNKFFQFSSDNTSDPSKVAFSQSYDYTISFSYSGEFMIEGGEPGTFPIETDVFLAAGRYSVLWDSYNAQEQGGIHIIVSGLETIALESSNASTSWVGQENEFHLESSGYYNIQIFTDKESITDTWGIRDLTFKNFNITSKWVALRRNTATNFVWDTSTWSEKYDNAAGIDYLQYLRIYASGDHRPTEYPWMWTSQRSTFESDVVNTKVGKRSLKINYPASDLPDFISYLEGDYFGHDENFSIKDSLSFWWYIEDIDKLYLDDGGFVFGSAYGYYVKPIGVLTDNDFVDRRYNPSASPATYLWKFKDLSLTSGWNYIRLRFDEHLDTIPDALANTDKLDTALDFRKHVTSTFGMAVAGKGEPFYMLLDDIKIERNWYYDEVAYGDKGLCLTWKDYAEIPLSGVDTRYGTIEVWLKLYTNTAGLDHFNNTASRTIFTLVDTANNSISLSIRSSSWFEVGIGNTKSLYRTMFIDPKQVAIGEAGFEIDEVLHVALAWSNDSSQMDGKDTVRLYINGEMYLNGRVTWDVGDSKNVLLRLGGGNTYLANNDDIDGSAIFSNVKLYNYCKTEFEINQRIPPDIENLTPNNFVQLSTDGIEFIESRDPRLPLVFNEVEPGEKITVFVRVDKSRIDELDRLTGSINAEWKVPV